MFSSYLENPTNCRFEGQNDDEDILLLLRAHPITNFPWIFWAGALALAPFLLPQAVLLAGLNNLLGLPDVYRLALFLIDYLLVLVVAFEGFLHWYFNVYLVTSKRVIDVTFQSLLRKNIDMAPLANIEEADSIMAGLLGTIFNFGDVAVQTAGATVAIDMKKITNPSEVADFILDKSEKGVHAS